MTGKAVRAPPTSMATTTCTSPTIRVRVPTGLVRVPASMAASLTSTPRLAMSRGMRNWVMMARTRLRPRAVPMPNRAARMALVPLSREPMMTTSGSSMSRRSSRLV